MDKILRLYEHDIEALIAKEYADGNLSKVKVDAIKDWYSNKVSIVADVLLERTGADNGKS